MKRTLYSLISVMALSLSIAQNPAGNAFRIDYEEFQTTNTVKFFNCGNNDVLNTGDELTVMTWIQFRDVNDNQKIIGKFDLDDSGFVLGVWQGKIYSEAWNPDFLESLDGAMNLVDMDWYHLAMTYEGGGFYTTYINGEIVGEYDVPDSPITANDNPLIIGIASWADNSSFQSFGNIDEMAVYNSALSQEEIRQQMFVERNGDETGLVAAYTFNIETGNSTPDISGNGNDGVGNNFSGTEWVNSTCIIADEFTETATDLHALWSGLTLSDPRFTTTTNGMNLVASGLSNEAYAVFGHEDGSGITADDIPSNAPADFVRSARVWPLTALNNPTSNVIINLDAAAAGGDVLTATETAENYSLLWREAGSAAFTALAQGSTVGNGVVVFENVSLWSGDYAIGVGSAPIEPNGLVENLLGQALRLVPNPSNGTVNVSIDADYRGAVDMELVDITGRSVVKQQLQLKGRRHAVPLDLSEQPQGVYFVKLYLGDATVTQRLVLE